MTKDYNKIHEKLVSSKNDFTGMIAYSIYKKEKKDAIKNGLDIEEFIKLKAQRNEIKKYKKEAEDLVNIFLETAADKAIEKVKDELTKKITKLTIEDFPSESSYKRLLAWHNNGAAGIVGNFWTGVVIAVFIWIMAEQGAWTNAKESAFVSAKQIFVSKTAEANTQKK